MASSGATFAQPCTLPPAGASAPPAPSPAYVALAPLAAVPIGLSSSFVAGAPIVVVRSAAGTVKALSGVCPHKKGELALGDMEDLGRLSVICPRHRVKFPGGLHIDASDGSVFCVQPPTPEAGFDPSWRVPTYAVVERDGWLFVAKDADAPATAAATAACVSC